MLSVSVFHGLAEHMLACTTDHTVTGYLSHTAHPVIKAMIQPRMKCHFLARYSQGWFCEPQSEILSRMTLFN